MAVVSSVSLLPLGFSAPTLSEPNPPHWPDSVAVFAPGDADIGAKISAAYASNGGHEPANHGQFSSKRFAFMFKPGTYDVDVPVGYYTQVLGLGALPSDVTFTSAKGVYSEEQDYSAGGALSTFWRAAENFKTTATYDWQAGEASGGFMANMRVGAAVRTGHRMRGSHANSTNLRDVSPGSQQQWFARDSTVAGWDGGVWNMVFTGVDGSQPSHCGLDEASAAGASPVTSLASTPSIAEKPFITFAPSTGKYSLVVPSLKTASHGADFDGRAAATATATASVVPFEHVYVTAPTDSAATINAKLAAGLHVVFSPAIYHLEEPLRVETAGTVLLGLGLATLVSARQNTLIRVGDVDGVQVAGLLLQAGPGPAAGPSVGDDSAAAPVLLQWGTGGGYAGSAAAPGLMHDLSARVGGPDGTKADPVAAATMVHVQSGHVIGDNLWLWRADHAAGGPVSYATNPVEHGLVVDGDDVTMYGLAVEHTTKDLTVWNGERGATYFYQSELPYGATQAEFGDAGYCGYRVAPHVQKHGGWGIGVYSFFRDDAVTVESGIVCPSALEASFVAPLTVFLSGKGGIKHVINDKGNASLGPQTSVNYVC